MTDHLPFHVSADELTLHYYGESSQPAQVSRHLDACPACAATFNDIAATLALVEAPVPERGDHYGLEVWQRLRPELPARRPLGGATWRAALAVAAALALSIGTFVAGRSWPAAGAGSPAPAAPVVAVASGDRARVAAISDHLERSERLLVDLTNGQAPGPIAQASVADLVDDNRLYREAAMEAGDADVAGVLDDLERALLDIVHAPSTLTPDELAVVRTRLDAANLLFKIRILSMEMRDRDTMPAAPRKTT